MGQSESKLHLKLMTDCKTEAEKTYKKVKLEIQNEQQMYKSHKPQELNSRRQTLQQSLACAACHLLRLQTDAHYDFVDRPIELLHHQSVGLQKCCMKPFSLLTHESSGGHITCGPWLYISGSHAHHPPFAFVAFFPKKKQTAVVPTCIVWTSLEITGLSV